MSDNINPLLDAQARAIADKSQAAYERLLTLIEGGMDPAQAVKQVQAEFDSAYLHLLQDGMTAATGVPVSAQAVADLPVSGLVLSSQLYRNTLQTAMEVGALVREHARGLQDARALALRLYDGYNPMDGILRPLEGVARADLPKDLLALVRSDIKLKAELADLLERVQEAASRIKTDALRAAYSELIDGWVKGEGQAALERRLEVAYREKTRYFANRIAQTELARAHADKVASGFMADDRITVVQVILSPAHVVLDICDFHARADLFGLGAGCYPKEAAPKPPWHPFCRCNLTSRNDLDIKDAKEVPGGSQDFLRSLPEAQAARVMGSKDRLFDVLQGGQSVDQVVNRGIDPAYRLKRLGDGVFASEGGKVAAMKIDVDLRKAASLGKNYGLPAHLKVSR